jgi:hypothetical protein
MVGFRGHELPGSINFEVISHLYWETIEPWKEIAKHYVQDVRIATRKFLSQLLERVAPVKCAQSLQALMLDAALEKAVNNGQEELSKLLQDQQRHPRYEKPIYRRVQS